MSDFDWHGVKPTTPEEDRRAHEMAPSHLKAHYAERMQMDPETRKLDLEARRAEAEVKRVAEVRAITDEVTKQKQLDLQIEEKQIEKEKVKQRRADQPIATADPNNIKLRIVRHSDVTEKNDNPYFLLEPYLIANSLVGFYGKGGSGKSSLLATFAADISNFASILWISTEETEENNLNRFVKGIQHTDANGAITYTSWGHDAALQVFQTVVTRTGTDGRAVESMFNVYEHLEPAIIMAKVNVTNMPQILAKPVRLVVLDTIVALTTCIL